MPSGQPQYPDIDALLRGAKRSLASADALQAEIDADARSMLMPRGDRGFLTDLASGLTEHPRETVSGFLAGAKDPAKRVGARLAENAAGIGQSVLDPVGTARDMGASIGQRVAFGQTPTLSEGVQFVTGIDPSSDYPEMAADFLAATLFARGMGMKGPELGRAPSPRFAVEPKLGPSEFAQDRFGKTRVSGRVPQSEGPIPVSSVPNGTAAERFAPNRSAGNFTGDPNAAAMPFQMGVDRYAPNRSPLSDLLNPEHAADSLSTGVDPYMPNTGAASLRPDFYAGADPIPPVVDRYAPNRGAASFRPDFYAAADPFSAPVVERYAPNVSTYAPEPVAAPVEAPAPSPEPSLYPGLSEWLAKHADAAPPEPVAEPVPTVRDLLARAPEPDALPEPIDTPRHQLGAAKSLSDIFPETVPEPVAPEPVTHDVPRPKLAANEVSRMLEGRQRFSEANPDVELAPGQLDELDRLGVEYGRTQSELKRLLGIPNADPAEVGRMRQGARELGSRLSRFAKNAASPTTVGATAALPVAAAIPDDPNSEWDNYARAGLMGAGLLGMAAGGRRMLPERFYHGSPWMERVVSEGFNPSKSNARDQIGSWLHLSARPETASNYTNLRGYHGGVPNAPATTPGVIPARVLVEKLLDLRNPSPEATAQLADVLEGNYTSRMRPAAPDAPPVTRREAFSSAAQTLRDNTAIYEQPEIRHSRLDTPEWDTSVDAVNAMERAYETLWEIAGQASPEELSRSGLDAIRYGREEGNIAVKSPDQILGAYTNEPLGPSAAPPAPAPAGKPASKIFADVSSGRAKQFHDVPDGIYTALRDKLGIKAAPGAEPSVRAAPVAADVPPPVAEDMHRFMSERGAVDAGLLAKWLGLPLGGAVAGSLLGDDAGEGALTGAALGGAAALAPTALRGLAKPGAINAHQTGSLLFSPVTLAKIATSNTSGALLKAAERGIEQRSFSPVSRMARELVDVPQLAADAREAWRNPDTHNRMDLPDGEQSRGMFGAATRAVGSLDAPFRKAMERAGMPTEDALTVTQQREPVTKFGKDALNLQRGSGLGRFLFPFMKSPVNAFETGLVEPIQSAGRLLRREGTRGDAAKVAMAAGAAGVGALADDALSEAPPWLQGLLMAMAGPYAVSAGIGRGLAKADPAAIQRAIPLGQGVNPSAKGLLARIVPRIFWDYGDK